MKADIHPKYYPLAKVACNCGHVFTTGSTQQTFHIDVCNKCHPFYTGQQKFVDTVGRIDRFKQKQEKAKTQIAKKIAQEKEKDEYRPPTLKEMLMEIK